MSKMQATLPNGVIVEYREPTLDSAKKYSTSIYYVDYPNDIFSVQGDTPEEAIRRGIELIQIKYPYEIMKML